MELIHWRIGDYSVFGYSAWQLQMYVQELMAITQSYNAEGSLDHQGSLFLCSAPLPQTKREGRGQASHVQMPANETKRNIREVICVSDVENKAS